LSQFFKITFQKIFLKVFQSQKACQASVYVQNSSNFLKNTKTSELKIRNKLTSLKSFKSLFKDFLQQQMLKKAKKTRESLPPHQISSQYFGIYDELF
jgi:hypothetical protein